MTSLSHLRMSVGEALQKSPPALDHVLPGLLSGTLGALIAPGGAGKSMILTQIAAAIASGQPLLGGAFPPSDASPRKVVMFFAEESFPVMCHRLHAAAKALIDAAGAISISEKRELIHLLAQNLCIYPLDGHGDVARVTPGADSYKEVREICDGSRLVVFDPLRRFHNGDENDSAEMTSVVNDFQHLARDTGAAIILAHHANRSSTYNSSGEQASASRGSSALTDGVRWQANITPLSQSTTGSTVRLDIAKANYTKANGPIMLQKSDKTGAMMLVSPDTQKAVLRKKGCT